MVEENLLKKKKQYFIEIIEKKNLFIILKFNVLLLTLVNVKFFNVENIFKKVLF